MTRETVTTTLRWTGDWPWYLAIGLAAFLAVTAFVLYRRDILPPRGALRWLLPLFRALAIFLIVLMLAGPVLHHRRVIGDLARLIVAVDTSESMQLTDAAMDAGRKVAIARKLGLLDAAQVPLDLPMASERLGNARSLAASLAALETPDEVSWKRIAAEFAVAVADADSLFAKAARDSDTYQRFRGEVANPVKELAAREVRGVDDRSRAAAELQRFGEMAGRWAADLSTLFQQKIDNEPALASVKMAFTRLDTMPRWQRVQAYLSDGKPGESLLSTLASQHDVQVVLMNNGRVDEFWRPGAAAGAPPSALPEPAGEITDLHSALKFALGDESRAERGAVLMLTDGQHNAGPAPLDTARVLQGRAMPVFTVGVGSQIPPRDLAVLRATSPDAIFYEDRVRGDIMLKEEVAPGQPYQVTIKDGDKTVWEKALITEGRTLRRVPFEFPIKELAESRLSAQPQGYEVLGAALDLTVQVSGLDGDRELSNNSAPLRFRAITQKRKILILDGRPRWETRYLRNLFERDEKWEVNTVIAGMAGETGIVRGDKPGTFPGDLKLLDAYDLVIFGEVPRTLLKDDELTALADFVGKRGGAMLFIDGARGVLASYGDSPLGPLMPVEWQGQPLREGIQALVLTERATTLGAFSLSGDLATNTDTWRQLPVPTAITTIKPQPGAETLLEVEMSGGSRVPAAVLRSFGAGRVYLQAFDDSWRWRYEVADQYHVRFWNQLASFVAEPPFAARDAFVQLDAGALTYQPGEQADVRVRLRDNAGRPVTDAAVSAVISRGGQRVATIPLNPDAGGLYRGKTASLEPGDYEVSVESAVVPEGQLKARTSFRVTARESAERSLLALNEDLLRQISVASGGEYLREEHIADVVAKLRPLSNGRVEERDTVLWQDWWWFMPIVLLLTLEWFFRKRTGML